MKKKSFFTSILLIIFYLGELHSQTDTLPPLPVKNLIYPTVKAKAFRTLEGYIFDYSLSNGTNALQDIYSFMIDVKASVTGASSPIDWKQRNLNYDTIQISSWSSEDSIADIGPNVTVTGFEIKSLGLPMVGRYWVAAWEVIPSEEGQYNDASFGIFATHLCRTTIGPVDPPNPFVPFNFLDTLINYTTQSRSLGWIKDQATTNKYLSYFASAKTSLQQNNISVVHTTLQQVLQDANVDSTSNLTSEAYALIRYNTEYLLQQLPAQPPTPPILFQIDVLRRELASAFAKNWIGDSNFVNELDNHLENAQRHLAKGDSVNCSKEIGKFQDKVQKEYEKKSKSKDKRFVTEEGYKFLYFNAQYIIDRLPGKK